MDRRRGCFSPSSDGGKSWTLVPAPAGTSFLNAIACPTSVNCVVVGGGIEARGGSDQDILTTSDGGQTSISRPVPPAVTGTVCRLLSDSRLVRRGWIRTLQQSLGDSTGGRRDIRQRCETPGTALK